MTKFILIRHGETEWNLTNRVQGHTDIPLNETGRTQIKLLAARLAGEKEIKAVYASDLQRAVHTAEAITAFHPHLTVRQDARLREIMLGRWEARSWEELEAAEGDLVRRWQADISAVTAPGGETIQSMADRLSRFMDDVTAAYPDETIVVASHGGAIRMMIALAMECPLRMAWRFGTANTSIAELIVGDGGPYLMRLNDTEHLNRIV